MRLRLVLHGRRRRRGLGGLKSSRRALAGALVACCLALTACGRDAIVDDGSHAQGTGSLAIGISEPNPSFFWSPAARPDLPPPFGVLRDQLVSMQPRYYRLFIDWASFQPPGRPLDLARQKSGCIRDVVPPCAPYAGVREQLQAVASAQRRFGGFEVMVVPYATPRDLAPPETGCQPANTSPAARPPGAAEYRTFIRAVLATARRAGVDVRYWSAWNEPNHPAFVSPQRERCDISSPALSPAIYTRLVRALRQELDAAPGDQQIVMGELAGYDQPRPTASSVTEFVDALPRDVVCDARIWGQHAYVGERAPTARGADYAGDADLDAAAGLLGALKRSLDAKRCPQPLRIWITETGVGGERAGRPRSLAPADLVAGCKAMSAALRSWYADPRVDAAFQYTFREADTFPVGLVDTALTTTFPTYELWAAWGSGRPAGAPAPPLPAACRG